MMYLCALLLIRKIFSPNDCSLLYDITKSLFNFSHKISLTGPAEQGGLGGLQPPQYLHQDNVSKIYFGEGGGVTSIVEPPQC